MSEHVDSPPFPGVVKFRNQDYERIRSCCFKKGVLWQDPNFKPDIGDLIWKRPSGIVTSPCLFQTKTNTHDVRQGILNDGYMAVAMQALTVRPKLLHWVVPENQQCSKNNSGVVHFRIWQLGTWYDICVDDRLPTKKGKLAYIHSINNTEFWCALLEKAYAKLYGSYKAVETGNSADAMVDFSGGISESIFLNNVGHGIGNMLLKADGKKLLMCCEVSKDDSCSLKILKDVDHYAITKVQYHVKSNIILVRLKGSKNSHNENAGYRSGPRDSSLNLEMAKKDYGVVVESDREFWMSDVDFKEHFTTLTICHVSPDTFMNSEGRLGSIIDWREKSFRGEWVRGISAGGAEFEYVHKNYQYRITLAEPDDGDKQRMCSVVISLMQKNKFRQLEWNLGFKILKVDNPRFLKFPLIHEFFAHNPHNFGLRLPVTRRELANRQKLMPGLYCIIPCTKHRNEEGKFLLRIFTRKEVKIGAIDRIVSALDPQDIAHELAVHRTLPVAQEHWTDEDIVKLFCNISGKDMTLDWEGLKIILDTQGGNVYYTSSVIKALNAVSDQLSSAIHYVLPTSALPHGLDRDKITYSKELCRTLIDFKDEEKSGKIGFNEFDELWSEICQWKLIFHLHASRRTKCIEAANLSKALEKAGFVLNKEVLNILIHRYADELGNMSIDDFIMCVVTLHLGFNSFNNSNKGKYEKVNVPLKEWIKISLFF